MTAVMGLICAESTEIWFPRLPTEKKLLDPAAWIQPTEQYRKWSNNNIEY